MLIKLNCSYYYYGLLYWLDNYRVKKITIFFQTKLLEINEGVQERMKQFKGLELLAQRLDSPTLAVTSPVFSQLLDQIDHSIIYMQTHVS